jgi:protein-S-isoprenylcysteine O-methyltransferase Ste14
MNHCGQACRSPTMEIQQSHSLITCGVYRYIRHPIYAAMWLWGIAQALLLQNFIAGLAGLVSFLPLYLFRVGREEQMMSSHFGEAYQTYMNRTGRIIPRINP